MTRTPLTTGTAALPQSQTLQGIGLAVLAMALFSVQDAFVKYMSAGYPVIMILFLRSLGVLPCSTLLVLKGGGWQGFRTRRIGLHIVRGSFLFVMFVSFYTALTTLPLASAIALVFSAPLMTCLLSVPILGERIGWHRIVAVLIGFLGVLIMLRPGTGTFEWVALLCILASFCYACAMVLTRYLGSTESVGTLVFYPNVIYLVGAAFFLPFNWTTPSAFDLALLVGLGLWTFSGHLTITQAYRIASPPALAPFDYTTLVWALLWGWLFWNEWPPASTLAGAAVVVAAGLYVVYREAQSHKQNDPQT